MFKISFLISSCIPGSSYKHLKIYISAISEELRNHGIAVMHLLILRALQQR